MKMPLGAVNKSLDDGQLPTSLAFCRPVIAVLIPCYNEAAVIGKVIGDFQATLPGATALSTTTIQPTLP